MESRFLNILTYIMLNKLQIVNFDTAKDLNEIGFNWRTTQSYRLREHSIFKIGQLYHSAPIDENWIKAPEVALVIKWFLDKYNLFVTVESHFRQWFWKIVQINRGTDSMAVHYVIESQKRTDPNAYLTYDEAELEGIKKCIKHLKPIILKYKR